MYFNLLWDMLETAFMGDWTWGSTAALRGVPNSVLTARVL